MSTRIRTFETPDVPSVEKLRHHCYARWEHAVGNRHVPVVGMVSGHAEPEREQGRVRLLVLNAHRGGA